MPLLISLLLSLVTFESVSYGSYEKLTGSRLRRFERSAGLTELNRLIRVDLSPKILRGDALRPFGGSRRWVFFEAKGVTYYVDRRDPYLAQARRKAEKSAAGTLIVRGRVMRVKGKGLPAVAVRVDGLRKTSRSTKGAGVEDIAEGGRRPAVPSST
jgi:hypothetical protein